MTRIMMPAVRLHHFWFGTYKCQMLDFYCTECTYFTFLSICRICGSSVIVGNLGTNFFLTDISLPVSYPRCGANMSVIQYHLSFCLPNCTLFLKSQGTHLKPTRFYL
jgi:hypothetical protein